MAVPGSGAITMLGIAQERKYGSYGFGTISSPITMFDLLNGGGSNGFPALNECPQPNVPSYSMSGWYGYNQTESCGGGCTATFLGYDPEDNPDAACSAKFPYTVYTQSTTPLAPWQDDSPIFDDDECSNPAEPGWYSNGEEVAFFDGGAWINVMPCGLIF